MMRPHRAWHQVIWLVMPVLLAIGIAAGLCARPTWPVERPEAVGLSPSQEAPP